MSIFPWVMDAGRLRNSFFGGRTTFPFCFFYALKTTERRLARYTGIVFSSPKLAPAQT
jgi:hypothetical protein